MIFRCLPSCKARPGTRQRRWCWVLLGCVLAGTAVPAHADSYAPIFTYFQIGRDEAPSANLRVEQFQAHIDLLKRESFSVASVPDIIAAFESGRSLPDKTVGLTFDEANRSVTQNALPLLRQAGLTATIFVTPSLADRGGAYMSWDELRRAARDGFTIGAKIDADVDEDSSVKMLAAVNEALVRIQAEIGVAPTLFSYTDGISTPSTRDLVRSRGFHAAFAMQSGPASNKDDRFVLPRFSMTEAYGTTERFRAAALSIPFDVADVLPEDPTITGANPPQIGFTVLSDDVDMATVACFIEDQGKAPLDILGNRVELRPQTRFEEDDTTRVNCTAPGHGENAGRWHWLGYDFFVPAVP